MTPEQIKLIEESFEKVAERAQDAATVFYNRLFSMKPALRLLFPEDLTEQKKKLMTMLGVAIKSLQEPNALIPVLENLGRRHALYGVRDEHYDTVGAALLLTLRDALGSAFTADVHAAWAKMYSFVAMIMKRATREIALSPIEQEFNLRETARIPKILSPETQAGVILENTI
jgi:hemoglobin-like flavoprotein